MALATWTEYPTPIPDKIPLTSQIEEALMETAAVALAPSTPTMPVSTKETSMLMICSMIAGQARCHRIGSRRRVSREVIITHTPNQICRLWAAALKRFCLIYREAGYFSNPKVL